jgi:hypothetical protein
MNPELGRELLADELAVKTVVVIALEGLDIYVTSWVREVGEDFVCFYSGVSHTLFIAFRLKDGTLTDDTGKRIHVWEYLGEV